MGDFQCRAQVGFEQGNPRFGPFSPRPLEGFRQGEAIALCRQAIHQDDLYPNRIPRRLGVLELPPEGLNHPILRLSGRQGRFCTFYEGGLPDPETAPQSQGLFRPVDGGLVLRALPLLPLGEPVPGTNDQDAIPQRPPLERREFQRSGLTTCRYNHAWISADRGGDWNIRKHPAQ